MALAGKGQSFPASGLMRESKTYNLHVCFQIFLRRTCRIIRNMLYYNYLSFLYCIPKEATGFCRKFIPTIPISDRNVDILWTSPTLHFRLEGAKRVRIENVGNVYISGQPESKENVQHRSDVPQENMRWSSLISVQDPSGSLPSVPQISAKVLLQEEGSASCSSCLCRGIQFHRMSQVCAPQCPCLEICLFCSSSL